MKLYFLGGVFYGAEGEILKGGTDFTVFQGGGTSQRTLLLREYVFFVEAHPCKTPLSASFAPAKLTRAEQR